MRGSSPKPAVPDHEMLRRIAGGSYGEVWLARNVMGTYRAVKVVFRDRFVDERPFEREFKGIKQFEPISRAHPGLVQVLQIGRNDEDGYFYYVMELADDLHLPANPTDAESPSQIRDPDHYQARTLQEDIEPYRKIFKHGAI